MNTWLDRWDRRYTDRVRLLVEILPVLARELLARAASQQASAAVRLSYSDEGGIAVEANAA